MKWRHWLICEVEQFFDEEFDGTLCRVKKVLQAFDSEDEANHVCTLMDPCRFEDYDTVLRVVKDIDLGESFR